jgi:lysozyme family protein
VDADQRFQRCAAFVLEREGWGTFTDDPRDPGGPTRWGITLKALQARRGESCTAADVERLSEDAALWIYRDDYWDAVGGDDLPAGVDLIVFDAAVNQGAARAARFLQTAAGVEADGVVGPQTLAAVQAANADSLIDRIKTERVTAYWETPGWSSFGHGWANRLAGCVGQAHRWADE